MDNKTSPYIIFFYLIIKSAENNLNSNQFNKFLKKSKIFRSIDIIKTQNKFIERFSEQNNQNYISNNFKSISDRLYYLLLRYLPEQDATNIFQGAYLRVAKNQYYEESMSLLRDLPPRVSERINYLKAEILVMNQVINFMAEQFKNKELIESYMEKFSAIKNYEESLFGYSLETTELNPVPVTRLQEVFEKGL